MTNATVDEARQLTAANAMHLETWIHYPDEERSDGVKPCEINVFMGLGLMIRSRLFAMLVGYPISFFIARQGSCSQAATVVRVLRSPPPLLP